MLLTAVFVLYFLKIIRPLFFVIYWTYDQGPPFSAAKPWLGVADSVVWAGKQGTPSTLHNFISL